jgi:cytochrome c peroxidase
MCRRHLVALTLAGFGLWPCDGAFAQTSFRLPPLLGLDEYIVVPDDDRLTAAKIALGGRLFVDPLLSRDRSISCASCHHPDHAFADTVPRSRGVGGRLGRRNTPAIINRAYGSSFFWDGRAESLEAQVLAPIQDSLEMDLRIDELVRRTRLDTSYRSAFAAEFPDAVTSANIARALATYVRAIRSGESAVDRYASGDSTALAADARRGQALFVGRANCSSCHVGANFTDELFHNTGVGAGGRDAGRYAVSRRAADYAAFKTPTLRDVAMSAPYMHDGSMATLEEVIDFYDRGGRPNAGLDREIKALRLSAGEKSDLVAFLRALSGMISAGVPDPR